MGDQAEDVSKLRFPDFDGEEFISNAEVKTLLDTVKKEVLMKKEIRGNEAFEKTLEFVSKFCEEDDEEHQILDYTQDLKELEIGEGMNKRKLHSYEVALISNFFRPKINETEDDPDMIRRLIPSVNDGSTFTRGGEDGGNNSYEISDQQLDEILKTVRKRV